jgi:uncharacterized repeat protein (TIGR03803 family)
MFMIRIRGWKSACAVFLVCLAAASAVPAQTFTTLADFPFQIGSDGDGPGLVQGIDGNFYGITTEGGATNSACTNNSCGTVFKITPTGTLTILHTFCVHTPCTDGWFPAWLVRGEDGNFYGTTAFGGAYPASCGNGCGTIFRITPTGAFTTLYKFCALANCPDGQFPGSLAQSFASGGGAIYGDFYGVTNEGGANSHGTVFRLTPQGQLTVLYNFCAQTNCTDGSGGGALIQTVGGNFFGAVAADSNCKGTGSCGLVFRMTPTGALTTLHNFAVPADLNYPLVEGTDGFFYGTTGVGGQRVANTCLSSGCGTIFRISSGGKLNTLYEFCSQANCTDGNLPESGLIQSVNGNFYGTTVAGGETAAGTLFTITAMGTFNTLHTFCEQPNCADGAQVQQRLVEGTNGKFYGITQGGGSDQSGTVFSFDVGVAPFVSFLVSTGPVGKTVGILGQGFTGTTAVSFNGTPATFTVESDTYIVTSVPPGATTGLVTVTTPSVTLLSNVVYRVTP